MRRFGLAVRLDPSNVQASAFARAAGARRFCFNAGVAALRENHEVWKAEEAAGVPKSERIRPLSASDLERHWRSTRPDWANGISSWVFSWACRDVAAAHKNFLSGRAGFPRFAKKGRSRERFTIAGRDVALEAGSLTLPKIGRVRIAAACPAQARLRRLLSRRRARITSATVAHQADGTWWLSVKVERPVNEPSRHENQDAPVIGVDRGVKVGALAGTAEGEQVAELRAGRYRRKVQRKLRHAQREASRRYRRKHSIDEQSKNWRRSQARVGRLHAKVARQRADALHRFSRDLTERYAVIVLETLSTKNLMANRHLAAAIADQGWGELGRQIRYKALWRGGETLRPPRTFPSSKTCARCGWVKPKLDLSERVSTCEQCGHTADRDLNAAAILATWGEHALGRCPCVAQVRDPDPRGRSGALGFHACGGWVSAEGDVPSAVPSVETGTSLQQSAA